LQLLEENIKWGRISSFLGLVGLSKRGIIVEEDAPLCAFAITSLKMATTVLLVEDNSNIRLAMSTFLKLKGYEVREAGNCEDARTELAKDGISVTITDLNLPDGKGDELLAKASHPVIAMTGHVDEATKARVVQQGFAAFLPKPASFEQVIGAIESVMPKA
jgi:DNA-binding NtrC family response regulator